MGTGIHARQAKVPPSEFYVMGKLKAILKHRYWDGNYGTPSVLLTTHDILYITGLKDADIEGAEELLNLLNKHGSVFIWEE